MWNPPTSHTQFPILLYLCDVRFELWSLVPEVAVSLFDDRLHRLPRAQVVQALVVQRQKRAVRVLNLDGRGRGDGEQTRPGGGEAKETQDETQTVDKCCQTNGTRVSDRIARWAS